MHQIDPESEQTITDDDSLYPYVNNDIEYGLFEDIVDSYYLHSQIKDNLQCNHDCYSQHRDSTIDNYSNTCTYDYHHITQSVQDLSDSTQQNTLHSIEENASLFTDNTATHCDFNPSFTFYIYICIYILPLRWYFLFVFMHFTLHSFVSMCTEGHRF